MDSKKIMGMKAGGSLDRLIVNKVMIEYEYLGPMNDGEVWYLDDDFMWCTFKPSTDRNDTAKMEKVIYTNSELFERYISALIEILKTDYIRNQSDGIDDACWALVKSSPWVKCKAALLAVEEMRR